MKITKLQLNAKTIEPKPEDKISKASDTTKIIKTVAKS